MPMKLMHPQWEYMVERVTGAPKELREHLNVLGDMGWEVLAVVGHPAEPTIFAKRRKLPEGAVMSDAEFMRDLSRNRQL